MGGLFRSEEMQYISLILNEESSHEAMRIIGKFQMLHIEDHGAPDRQFYKDNKRKILECLVWKRKFEIFRRIMEENGLTPPGLEVEGCPDWAVKGNFLESIERYFAPIEAELEEQLKFKADEITDMNKEVERYYVLKFSQNVLSPPEDDYYFDDEDEGYGTFGKTEPTRDILPELNISVAKEQASGDKFTSTIYGTIPLHNQSQFRRMVFRMAKGPRNAMCKFSQIETGEGNSPINDPKTGKPTAKSMFCIVVVGSELPLRIKRICPIFDAILYNIPKTKEEINQEIRSSQNKKIQLDIVLKKTKARIKSILTSLIHGERDEKNICPLVCWEKYTDQEQTISEELQKFYVVEDREATQGVGSRIAAKCWVPTDFYSELQFIFQKKNIPTSVQTTSVRKIETGRMPPTFFKTNKFTGVFQGIVDTYGIADYQEANPGLFTIVTFPFLFGIMYGDIFHGSILLLGAIFMIYNEKKYLRQAKLGTINEIFGMAFGGRYLLLMMAIFAIYCGTLYNDCASIPLNLYGSRYARPAIVGPNQTDVFLVRTSDVPYPWGIDPEWSDKQNSLQFVNSFKMKFSVIIGVIQMSFGIFLGFTNDIHFKDCLSVIFEFLPRILFMFCTFGYMIFMIIYKTTIDWNGAGLEAPNLIQTMIKMFLSPGSVPSPPLYDQQFQQKLQLALLLIAVISIPFMLFPKALIKNQIWKRKYGHKKTTCINEPHFEGIEIEMHEDEDHDSHDHRTVGKHFSLSDDLITTSIHTIEFILGCVSNTASYLRLWALSLAHAELSEVFWNKMVMQYGLNMFPLGFVGIAIWSVSTAGVLLCMDVLECFLHALRLHWVEFQNKFYSGNGHKFAPFKIKEMNE